MPIYEYACNDCKHEFEMLLPVNSPNPEHCPSCGASNVRKLVSLSSFVLKGSGWYRDHYGLKPGSSEGSSGSDATSVPKESKTETSSPAPAAPAAAAPAAAPVAQAAK